jgi:hypothetical protein
LDTLAYNGIILNRFYANGGYKSIITGKYDRPSVSNESLLIKIFSENGYKIVEKIFKTHEEIDMYEHKISMDMSPSAVPFLLILRFQSSLKDPYQMIGNIDEFSGTMIQRLKTINQLEKSIIFFLSIDEAKQSEPLESIIRRIGFIFSSILKRRQFVSNGLFHVSDVLPTIITGSKIKLSKNEWDEFEGFDQWTAWIVDQDVRKKVYGNK